MTGPKHSCGVVGIYATSNVVSLLHKALCVIQHRGQESAGISVFDGKSIHTVKDNGLVTIALNEHNLANLDGLCGLGHVRYSTTGSKAAINAQPLTVETTMGTVAVAHNGDITNFKVLKEKYLSAGWSFLTDSDSEMIARLLAKHMVQNNDPIKAIRSMMAELDGAYSLTIMVNDRVYGVRDPYGFRPLCIGQIDGGYILVSESAAIDTLKGRLIRDVAPGEIVEITADNYVSYPFKGISPKAHCMFEWIYFARPESVIDEREVYDVRKKIGMILAREAPADVDIIMPVPDSGRAHALGYSMGSGIQYEEGFMKNRFVERTFIMPDQRQREKAVAMKMNPIKSTVNGRRVLIVDDSIVRGTTLRKLIGMLRSAGAKEVHVRIGCPPVIAPCYYGVDMKTRDQFIANFHTVDEICEIIGADSLAYISIPGLVEALGFPENDLCLACVNGKYPTLIQGETHRFQSTFRNDFQ
ncbi:MAG: amidophosphoribosyltransferase [Candidatus Methanomethylophilaceae archaeon]